MASYWETSLRLNNPWATRRRPFTAHGKVGNSLSNITTYSIYPQFYNANFVFADYTTNPPTPVFQNRDGVMGALLNAYYGIKPVMSSESIPSGSEAMTLVKLKLGIDFGSSMFDATQNLQVGVQYGIKWKVTKTTSNATFPPTFPIPPPTIEVFYQNATITADKKAAPITSYQNDPPFVTWYYQQTVPLVARRRVEYEGGSFWQTVTSWTYTDFEITSKSVGSFQPAG